MVCCFLHCVWSLRDSKRHVWVQNKFAASIGVGNERFKDTIADIPLHVKRKVAAANQAKARKWNQQAKLATVGSHRAHSCMESTAADSPVVVVACHTQRPISAPATRALGSKGAAKHTRRVSAAPGRHGPEHPLFAEARSMEAYLQQEVRKAQKAARLAAERHAKAEMELLQTAKETAGLARRRASRESLGSDSQAGAPVVAETVGRHLRHTAGGSRRRNDAAQWGEASTFARARRPSFRETMEQLGQGTLGGGGGGGTLVQDNVLSLPQCMWQARVPDISMKSLGFIATQP